MLWKTINFPPKKLVRRATLFYTWLNKRELDSNICFWTRFFVSYCFCWSIWRIFSIIFVAGKGKSILIDFRGDCSYSSLMLYQNSTSGRVFCLFVLFFRLVEIWILKPDQWTFHTLLHSNLLFYFAWISYPHMILSYYILVIWKILIHWVMWIFQMLTHLSEQYF